MFSERAFTARVESANTDELAHILTRPSVEEEKVLRAYLGDARYQRMHGIALKRSTNRGLREKKGNVVVIHGIMGSELTAISRQGASEPLWVDLLRIVAGQLDRLRLNDDGRTEYDTAYDIRASGIMKRHYGELLLALSEQWNVRAFWFDWRKDLKLAAAELEAQISGWFDDDTPIHIIAHSMGGLVARTFIKSYPKRWQAMFDRNSDPHGRLGGRLIMLGTPNHGSFAIPQVIGGLEGMVKWLDRLDVRHNLSDLLTILNSFVGMYQMLPSHIVMPSMQPLYNPETYAGLQVSPRHLENAKQHHEWLQDVIDPERMLYIAGYDQPTFCNITDLARFRSIEAYEATMLGDGRVPHQLGLLKTPDGHAVPTYYVEEDHGRLTTNQKVLKALPELLETGQTAGLSQRVPISRAGQPGDPASNQRAYDQLVANWAADEQRLDALVYRLGSRSTEPVETPYVSVEERKVEELVTRGFLSYQEEEQRVEREALWFEPPHIDVGLLYGGLDKLDDIDYRAKLGVDDSAVPLIDAISVGHYLGVKPQAAELALDKAISRALLGVARDADVDETDLILTQYSERGIIRGELGQPFFLLDPRVRKTRKTVAADRMIVIAGMGMPGRFNMPELTVLARELCWSLGRIGKRHLATVLIGSGNGNLGIGDAISAWMQGVKQALSGSIKDERRGIRRVTFVELDPRKIATIQQAILDEQQRMAETSELQIRYKAFDQQALQQLEQQALDWDRRERERALSRRRAGDSSSRVPTRVTLSLERNTYRFGAITETASIPERDIPLDPSLVMRANDELAAEWDAAMQLERGQFLEQLLVPDDLRSQIFTNAPLVMLLDATTARIHWELVAQSDLMPPTGSRANRSAAGSEQTDGAHPMRDLKNYFLGTSRGFTRQLRTTFAPPPEPPPPPRRVLRVLVVADPAEDAHLPGAEEEGIEVADLFESFNTVYEKLSENRVEVVRLFGPREATRTNVLRHLMLHSYDVLHFAGHCTYDRQDPAASGWIFTNRERLSANELTRIDLVPKFIFSNACESGITPERSEMRSVELAPSFAESFFARGVANFVCTAWPVDDIAARQFALTFYALLLGLRVGDQRSRVESIPPEPIHVAMRQARLAIASTPNGVRTWGAYQHYGNPYFRFFDVMTMSRAKAAVSEDEPDDSDPVT